MKKLFIAIMMLACLPSFAGKMKEIYTMTEESVLGELGFDESIVKIEGWEFVKVEGADLAVSTYVRMYYSMDSAPAGFDCLTTFKKTGDSFDVIDTQCKSEK